MISEKLDRVMEAEEAASRRISEAERAASQILADAGKSAAELRENRRASAKAEAEKMIRETDDECLRITEEYQKKAADETDKIGRIASKNEMFGMSTVIMKIIP